MTDSLLSYFGYEDRMSGTYWGGGYQVTVALLSMPTMMAL